MDQREIINKIDRILDDARTGMLATSDSKGRIHLRWMTPCVLRFLPNSIYCFTVPDSKKLEHITGNNEVQWSIQTRDLREIVSVRGRVNIIDNPATKSELYDTLGAKLATFWKANVGAEEFIVLETIIESAEYYMPIKGIRETVVFSEVQENGN